MSFIDLAGTALDYATTFAQDNWLFVIVLIAAFAYGRSKFRVPVPDVKLPDKPAIGCAIVVIVSLAWSIGAAAIHGIALPRVHDEYGYLLAADTFAHGHLAYPAHPMAAHFETMYVLQHPVYASQYAPAQGAMLALGLVLFGCAMAGAWVSCAMACAAIWWALRVWTSPRLALLGGLAAAIHPTMLGWSNSYWGGAIAAGAGALLLGAVGLLIDKPTGRSSILAGLAVAIFPYSRPYEGLVFTLAMFIVLLVASFSGRVAFTSLLRVAPAGTAMMLLAIAPLGAYNRAITGSAFLLPHTVYDRGYVPAGNFLWQKLRVIQEPNKEMADEFRIADAGQYKRVHAPGGLIAEAGKRIDVIRYTVFGRPAAPFESAWLLMLVPLIAWPVALRHPRVRSLTLALLLFAFAPFSILWLLLPHYLAPAAALAATLLMLLIRELRSTGRTGAFLSAAACLVFVANSAAAWAAFVRSPERSFEATRRQIAGSLVARGGKHLIIVAPDVRNAIFNLGDIDRQPVVWARDLGEARNRELVAYFRDRRVWYLRCPSGKCVIDEWSARPHPPPLP